MLTVTRSLIDDVSTVVRKSLGVVRAISKSMASRYKDVIVPLQSALIRPVMENSTPFAQSDIDELSNGCNQLLALKLECEFSDTAAATSRVLGDGCKQVLEAEQLWKKYDSQQENRRSKRLLELSVKSNRFKSTGADQLCTSLLGRDHLLPVHGHPRSVGLEASVLQALQQMAACQALLQSLVEDLLEEFKFICGATCQSVTESEVTNDSHLGCQR
ncbi:uncharacterized protein LOC122789861 [Protopterus annectens]|uniref:uncharacterized protein LOC122789861 n=1 Tax=Protopterus annectens TaxID=7888 RepID=UPI001CF9F4CD|nr:uncharacterized protein LOC122789861 [Protopterus annectens]